MRELWDESPVEYWDKSEYELRTEVRKQCGPMQKDFSLLTRIRIAFWEEYERAARSQEMVISTNLFKGVCRNDVYFNLFGKYPALFAWMVSPLAGYLLQRKELEFLAEERMIDVLSVSPVKVLDDGSFRCDSRWAKIQVEMYQILQDRIYGSVTQKISSEQKSVNVNVNSNQNADESTRTIALITNVEELDRRIKAIQDKRTALQTIAQPIEVNTQKLIRPDQIETNQE